MVKISLFGFAGTGTTTLAKSLSNELNLEFISVGNIFRENAKKLGLSLYEYGVLCDNNLDIDKKFDESIINLLKDKNNFIIDSRLGWYFFPDSVKIKLECDEDVRINRVSNRDGINFLDAKEKTLLRESKEQERYYKNHEILDYANNSNFDLIIDTSNVNIDEMINIVKDYLLKKTYL